MKLYVIISLVMLVSIGIDCKKHKQSFTFDALMSGMNTKEKEMFKEELNKEVKKFRASHTHHHQTKSVSRASGKKRKVIKKLPKFLPGICDPICAHECLHGCDFRCCIPDYQQNHKIPRPPPMVVLPGSCSSTCSPTCRPLCDDQCCGGGMFQSSKDLVTLKSVTCPSGCSQSCYPHCTIPCCVSHMTEYALRSAYQNPPGSVGVRQESQKKIKVFPGYSEREKQPDPQVGPAQTMHSEQRSHQSPGMYPRQSMDLQDRIKSQKLYLYTSNTKCSGMCPDYCAPLCLQACCISSKRGYGSSSYAPQHNMYFPPPLYQQNFMKKYSPALNSNANNVAEGGLDNKATVAIPPKQTCPTHCFSSCKPNCEVRCCNLQPNVLNQLNTASTHPNLHLPDLQSSNFMKAAAYRLKHALMMKSEPSKTNSMLISQLLPHMMPQQQVIQHLFVGKVIPRHSSIVNMDPNSGSFATNYETIHALSKDMISKPEYSSYVHATVKNAIPERTNRSPVGNYLEDGQKKSSIQASTPLGNLLPNVMPLNDKDMMIKKSNLPQPFQYSWGAQYEKLMKIQRQPQLLMPPPVKKVSQPVPKDVITSNVEPKYNSSNKQTSRTFPTKSVKKEVTGTPEIHYPSPIIILPKKSLQKDKITQPNAVRYPNPVIVSPTFKKSMVTANIKASPELRPNLALKLSAPNGENKHPAEKKTIPPIKTAGSGAGNVLPGAGKNNLARPDLATKKSNVSPTKNMEVRHMQDKKRTIPTDINNDKRSVLSCGHHPCPTECAPDCSKNCCNRQIVYQAYHKNQKKSKIAYQLEMLK